MHKRFKEITDEMVELFKRKNSDYGNSIHDTYIKYGPASYLVRMEDKINRVRTLTLNKKQQVETGKTEKVRDTLIDLANYSILMLLELEGANSDDPAFKICKHILNSPRDDADNGSALIYIGKDDDLRV